MGLKPTAACQIHAFPQEKMRANQEMPPSNSNLGGRKTKTKAASVDFAYIKAKKRVGAEN